MKIPLYIALFIYLSNDTKTLKYDDQKKLDFFFVNMKKMKRMLYSSRGRTYSTWYDYQ